MSDKSKAMMFTSIQAAFNLMRDHGDAEVRNLARDFLALLSVLADYEGQIEQATIALAQAHVELEAHTLSGERR